MLATVLTVASDVRAEDAAHLGRVFAREVAWHRGRALEVGEGQLVAMFDGPGRAAQCGGAIAIVAQRSNIHVRAGVHIGECDPTSRPARCRTSAPRSPPRPRPGEVLVSRTVVDLVPGSGIRFDTRGVVRAGHPERELQALAVAG